MGRSPQQNGSSQGFLCGRTLVLEAIEKGDVSIDAVMLAHDLSPGVVKLFRRTAGLAGIPCKMVPRRRLDKETGVTKHQGVAAAIMPIRYRSVEEICATIVDSQGRARPDALILILPNLQDPHNYGASIRSAVASGVAGLIVGTKGMSRMTDAVIRSSAGTALSVPIARSTNLVETVYQLKESGVWVYGLDGSSSDTIWETNWRRATALVLGREDSGIPQDVAAACDGLVRIPLNSGVESLNAAVAAAIALFEVVRARGEVK